MELHSGLTLVRSDTHYGYRTRGSVLLPAFSPALSEGIPGQLIQAHTCEYARDAPDIRFPAEVNGRTAFVILKPWNNYNKDNNVPAAVARACAGMGAKAVVLGLPERKYTYDIWGNASVVWHSYNPLARDFELEDWAVRLSGEAAAVTPVEVPVLLVLPRFAKEVAAAWQKVAVQARSGGKQMKSGWRDCPLTLMIDMPNAVKYFEDGRERGVLQLGTVLDSMLRAESLTEQRLDVVYVAGPPHTASNILTECGAPEMSTIKRLPSSHAGRWKQVKDQKWQCYYGEGLNLLTTHSAPANVSLLLLLSLRLMKESRLQHCAQPFEKVKPWQPEPDRNWHCSPEPSCLRSTAGPA